MSDGTLHFRSEGCRDQGSSIEYSIIWASYSLQNSTRPEICTIKEDKGITQGIFYLFNWGILEGHQMQQTTNN